MEAMMGETSEGNREEASNSSGESEAACVNGEVNGSFDDTMEVCSLTQHNIKLKVVSNKCLNEEYSNMPNSALNLGGSRVLDKDNCSDSKSATNDKVPISEPASVCRDLESEVPASVDKSVNDFSDKNSTHEKHENFKEDENVNSISLLCKDSLHPTQVNMDCDSGNDGSQICAGTNADCNKSKSSEDKDSIACSGSSEEKCIEKVSEPSSKTERKENCDNKSCAETVNTVDSHLTDSISESETNTKRKSGDKSENECTGDLKEQEKNIDKKVEGNQTDETKKEVNDSFCEGAGNEDPKKSTGEKSDKTEDGGKVDSSENKQEEAPAKVKKSRKSMTVMNLTPRRSSRNINKQKSYVEKEDDPEIQEITPVDPLADPLSTDPLRDDKENTKTRSTRKNTIVVNDTKRLVEIAAGSKNIKGGKKEPTLVIIDTNSILSGRGPVPVGQGSSAPGSSAAAPTPATLASSSSSISASSSSSSSPSSSSGFSVLPIALPAQGLYPPIRVSSPLPVSPLPVSPAVPTAPASARPPAASQPQILPTLTDDMYVVEAPSFIVPYVYEKPPIKPLKEFLERLGKEIKEMKKNVDEKTVETGNDSKDSDGCESASADREENEVDQVKKDKPHEEGEEKDVVSRNNENVVEKQGEQKDEERKDDHGKDEEAKDEVRKDEDRKDDERKDEDRKDEESDKVLDEKGKDVCDKIKSDESSERDDDDDDDDEEEEEEEEEEGSASEDTNKNQGIKNNLDRSSSEPDVNKQKSDENKDEDDDKVSKDEDKSVDNKSTEDIREKENKVEEGSRGTSYFDNPLGKFFMQIGINLVQEYVQTDLLRSQKRKRDREGRKSTSSTQFAINSLVKNLEFSKENNEPFHLEQKKCEYCSFKTESSLVMAQHLETPHMRNYVYRCNFCPLEVRSPHDILFHMEAEHNVRGRLERAPAFHQCPNCPFEDSQKGKLTRHLLSCGKKYKPDRNQEPPPDWEPPAKIPRLARSRPTALGLGAAAYQAMASKSVHPLLPKLVPGSVLPTSSSNINRGRGRPPIHGRYLPQDIKAPQRPIAPTQARQSMLYRPGGSTQQQVLLPTAYQIAGSQIYQVVGSQGQMMPMVPSSVPSVPRLTLMSPSSANSSVPTPVALVPNIAAGNNSITIQTANKNPTAKLLQQPSISITPLPRQPAGMAPGTNAKHAGHSNPAHSTNKATFVICEICDGYIKDLEQLRNHMQWIHKVKIHPKMIYNRPPLNCQKCQFRFFTDQGLERHLLGSHGLVTSSMQEAANKGKDGGRCPVCGRVYQWKLLNHVARDHNMSLKPAHLSYKCTVCTATFGMYKQFENHVYSAHSVVAKRVIDKKSQQVTRPQSSETLLKPLKINDEITIIPQPARPRPGPASRTGAVSAMMQQNMGKVYSCEKCEATFDGQTGFTQYLSHLKRRHLRRCGIKVCRLEDCPTCKRRHITKSILDYLEENKSGVDVIELSDDEVVIAGQGRNEITITKVSCAPGPKRFKQRLQQRHNVQVIELEDSPMKKDKATDDSGFQENGEDTLNAVKERLRRRKSLEISQVDSECSSSHTSDETPAKKRRRNDDE